MNICYSKTVHHSCFLRSESLFSNHRQIFVAHCVWSYSSFLIIPIEISHRVDSFELILYSNSSSTNIIILINCLKIKSNQSIVNDVRDWRKAHARISRKFSFIPNDMRIPVWSHWSRSSRMQYFMRKFSDWLLQDSFLDKIWHRCVHHVNKQLWIRLSENVVHHVMETSVRSVCINEWQCRDWIIRWQKFVHRVFIRLVRKWCCKNHRRISSND